MRAPVASPLVALRGVAKGFGAVRAVRGVDLELLPGEVHALVGENGAGKSTIVKMLAGLFRPDSGMVEVAGEPVELSSPLHASALGIAVIHQQPALFPDLDVAENVFAGRLPRGRFGRVDRSSMYETVATRLQELGVELDPRRPAEGLSMAEQQLVEIAKALSRDARLVVMDEPTASLSAREVEELLRIARDLRARGVAILYVSHHLEEVFSIADRVTILRDGLVAAAEEASRLTIDSTVRLMVGRSLEAFFVKEAAEPGEAVLEAKGLTRTGVFHDVSFSLHAGEVLGFAGLVGAGRTEIARAIFGVDRLDAGELLLRGRRVRIDSPADAVRNGIAYVPEDRHSQGAVLELSIAANIALPNLRKVSHRGLASRSREDALARAYFAQLQIRAHGPEQRVGALSGGNQQKVVLAKWLSTRPSILILDEPTHGIDVGTKAEVHRLVSELAREGMAIVLISSELPEILGMSDRVLVFREGELAAELPRAEATAERIMFSATGQEDQAVAP